MITIMLFSAVPAEFNLLYAVCISCTGSVGNFPLFVLFPVFADTNTTVASCHIAFKCVTEFGISSYNPYIVPFSIAFPLLSASAHPAKLFGAYIVSPVSNVSYIDSANNGFSPLLNNSPIVLGLYDVVFPVNNSCT